MNEILFRGGAEVFWKKKSFLFSKSIPSSFSVQQNYLEGLLKYRLVGPTPRVSNLVGLGWGLRIWISNRLLGDASFADLGTTV